jgi:hypothetical protein
MICLRLQDVLDDFFASSRRLGPFSRRLLVARRLEIVLNADGVGFADVS